MSIKKLLITAAVAVVAVAVVKRVPAINQYVGL